jgi:M6 family metalloprotease-like protein
MNKRLIAFLSILSLFLSTPIIPVNAAAKAGGACTKAGITSVASGKTYTCVKSGKKLVWNKGVKVAAPKVSPTVAVSTLTSPIDYLNISSCKLVNGSNQITVNQSFQQNPYRIRNTKPIRALIFPIDFPDLIGTSDPKKDFVSITEEVSQYYKQLSDNRSIFNWTIYPKYVRYESKVVDANLAGRTANGYGQFSEKAMNLAKQTLDLSSFDLIVYAPPLITSRDQIAIGPAWPSSNSNQVSATMLDGQSYGQSFPFLNLTHEIGHLMGLADLYNFDAANESANSGSKSAFELQFKYMGIFDLMNWANGAGVELTAWNRWLTDLITDDQIRCLPSTSTTTLLAPIEVSGGIKGAVIPLSTTEAIVIESRRALRYDKDLIKESEGALVYKVNTSTSTGLGPMRIVGRPGSTDVLHRDASLKLGQSYEVSGYLIKVIESGVFGDVIKVEKVS